MAQSKDSAGPLPEALLQVRMVDINDGHFPNFEAHKTAGDTGSGVTWFIPVGPWVTGLQLSFLALLGMVVLGQLLRSHPDKFLLSIFSGSFSTQAIG